MNENVYVCIGLIIGYIIGCLDTIFKKLEEIYKKVVVKNNKK